MPMMRELRCELDTEQLATKAEALAQATAERREKKTKAKNEASLARAELKKLDERILQLTRDYQDRSETRQVECTEVFDHRRGEVRVVRLDTDETIDSRPMTAEERQQKLPTQTPEDGVGDTGKSKPSAPSRRAKPKK